MRHLLFTTLLLILFISNGTVFAQDKSFLKNNKIKSITVYEQKADRGNFEVLESITLFDKNGNVVEEKELNSEGKVKSHYKYEYDDFSKKIKETSLGDGEKIIEVQEYIYKNNLKTERITYNAKGKVIQRKRYVYEKFE